MIWHIEKIESLISYFGSDEKLGLSSSNANIMREKFGENKITPAPQNFKIVPFLMDILSVRVVLLFSAFVISFIYAIITPDYSPFESLILLTAFLIYLCFKISIFFKKQKDISNSLKTSDTTTVIRDGKEITINTLNVVPGDILVLKAGDKICADARIITSQSLVCDEQILFGKTSLVVKNKNVAVPQRADFRKQVNMLFSGTYIVKGNATAIVVATGDNTAVVKNGLLNTSDKPFKTPLQRRLSLIAHSFQIIGLIAFALVFLIGILINHEQNNSLVLIMLFAFAILPVSFEWLYNLSVTHFTKLLAKIGIMVKTPLAFENLAKTKILAIPKNRVLTENNVSVTEIWCGEEYTVPLTASLSNEAFAVIKMAALCSNENRQRKNDNAPLGTTPTDSAIISALLKNGTKKTDLDYEFTRLAHIPFDSERRMMSTINRLGNIPVVITKGSFEAITQKCTEGISQSAVKCYEDMCSRNLNVIAVAYKRLSSVPAEITETAVESELVLLGLIGLCEDIKEDAYDCLSDLSDAEINTVLFSDSDLCVCNNLATKLKIADETTLSANDEEISNLDFSSNILNYRVFPHISKESKLILLKLWKRAGATAFIATNKIPDYSIAKAYDVSCAMGEDCADILSNSADIVVRDYDLTSLVSAIVTGRKSTLNIKKAISFVCTCNLNILLNFIIFTFSGLSMPITPIAFLTAIVFTIFIPAISLVFQPAEYDVMSNPSYSKKSSLITPYMIASYALNGIAMAVANFSLYLFVSDDLLSHSAFFLSFCALNIVLLMCKTSTHSLFVAGFTANRRVVFSVILAVIVVVSCLFVPFTSEFFGITSLTSELYSIVLAISVGLFVLNEIVKLARFVKNKLL